MTESSLNINIYTDHTSSYIVNIKQSLDNAMYVLANRADFSPEFVMFAIEAKITNSATYELALSRASKAKEAMKGTIGRKKPRHTSLSQDCSKVAKHLGVKTTKAVKAPTLVQGGAQGTGKKK